MPDKQKPQYDVVKRATKLIKDPSSATPTDIQRMAGRILDDERNSPDPNKTVPKPPAVKKVAPKAAAPKPRSK